MPTDDVLMQDRSDFEFTSKGVICRAWFYPAADERLQDDRGVPCVVMAHGLGGTRDAGLEPYAERFAAAGMAVLLFDYRYFGASDGKPRQLLSVTAQLQDWKAAIAAARAIDGVDAQRIALWGSSFSGGHVICAGASDQRVAAIVSQGPMMDGQSAVLNVLKRHGLLYTLKLVWAGLRDVLANLAGAEPYLIPIVAKPGTVAAMSTPDAYDGFHAIAPESWRNEMTARTTLYLGLYRPVTHARRLPCPTLVQICDDDTVAPIESAQAAVARANGKATERHYHIGHFDIYRGAGFRQSSADQLEFFTTHLAPRHLD